LHRGRALSATIIDWFAGIGSARLAAERAGWRCVWSCERDPVARDVYGRQFGRPPDAADLLDVSPADIPESDCWVGGFPCQDLSVAGQRRGFGGERSVLVFRFLKLARAVRPPWLLLENVPGLLSVRGGADFGALLIALEDAGYVGAWRVLDARWFGVPQRRRRVFLLARRAGAPGPDPAEILLEPEGMRGGAEKGGAAGEDVAKPLGTSTKGRQCDLDHGALVTNTIPSSLGSGPLGYGGKDELIQVSPRIPAHLAKSADSDGNGLVADPIIANKGKCYSHEGSHNFRLRNVVTFDLQQITAPAHRAACEPGSPAPTLNGNYTGVAHATGVRRLMPIEAERLQGLPDNYTNGHADTVRYRLIGNAMAVPCVEWIFRRLRSAHDGDLSRR
jgi:DNA (cytosine-5)-methyltransferase 1